MRDINSMSRDNVVVPNRPNLCPCTEGLLDKDRTIKGLVVCHVVWLGSYGGDGS